MYYHDTYRGGMGIFFSVNLCCFGTKYDAKLEKKKNVLPSFILSTSPYIKIRRKLERTVHNAKNCALLACLAQRHSRSRPGAERIRQGEGRWSRPPKTALKRSGLTEKFQFRESHTEAETKKTPDQIPVP